MKTLSLLIKPASGSCNMRCQYCFYADVTDLREVKNRGLMTMETLEITVKKALSEATRACTIGFQGGEPTLAGLPLFQALVAFEKKYNVNRVAISHAIQTNGMILDEEWAAFLAENRFLVGLSIDGGKAVHDTYRLDASRKGTHNHCLKTARLLKKAGVDFNILTVVTRDLAAHPDRAYQFYKQQGFGYVQFIPCLDGLEQEHGSNAYSLSAQDYGKFLCRVLDLWYEDFTKGVYQSIRAFDNYIHMLLGHPPENCAMGGICNAYALIEADGSVYPCDFYAVDEYLLGNVATHSFEEMLGGADAEAFIAPSRLVAEECRSCEAYFLCRGGCRRDRKLLADGALGCNYYCEAYKVFFAHSLPKLQHVARMVAR